MSDNILDVNIEEQMKDSYIDYAMSVIVSRALPDVRDGLKPVHRRILYAMNELNLDPGKPYKKSMRIVGDAMGKYHPHGDASIYDAMVRMAQDFSMRYVLVDGHGNFGSMDGDSAAAARYTEARLSKIAVELLEDIEKETVDFTPNYNEEFLEPTVLPSRYPNLLVNGSSGIAVGMATNIPPHNLSEVIDGILKIIDNKVMDNRETDVEELISIIKGPDFPTGAYILGSNGIKAAFRTGRGKVCVRAKAEIETMDNGREMIVVTEIPYQVNKARMLEKIGELVKEKKIDGITDLRDETDRNGVRVVIELKKDANANVIMNQLYKYSQMQENIGIIMLALVNNEPKILNLKEMLGYYLNHQKQVILRRTQFELRKAEKRAHILEGLLKALEYIDEVISLIRSSKDVNTAKIGLMERFELTEEQSAAIVNMRLGSLSGLESKKLEDEYSELKELIRELNSIIDDEKRLYGVIKEELLVIKAKYGDERKTDIVYDSGEIDMEDLIDDEINVITMTHFDYIKRLPLNTYKSQNRGGKGVIGMQTRDEDLVKNLFIASTHDYILFFTSKGRVYRIKAYEIKEAGRTARGTAIVNLLSTNADEKITAVIPIRNITLDGYLIMVTKKGVIKKTKMSAFEKIRQMGMLAINLHEDDDLISVMRTNGENEIFVATKKGKGIRFSEKEVRPVGRNASGVRAIRLRDDFVIGAEVMLEGYKILFVSEKGYGKCTEMSEFKSQSRGGLGTKVYKITEKTGGIVGINLVTSKEELMIINSEGVIIRIRVNDISTLSRVTQGVKLINLGDMETVVSIAKIEEDHLGNHEEDGEEKVENDDIHKMV